MSTWLRILCPLDLTEKSRPALEEAAELARRFGAELTIAHVLKKTPVGAVEGASAPELLEAEAAELASKLERWRSEAERLVGRRVRTVLESGSPAAEIVHLAKTGSYDVVVTGAPASGLARILGGSVAERVARDAPCPVLVMREPPEQGR